MKYADIKDLTSEELRKRERLMREELFMAKMKNSIDQSGRTSDIRVKRRDVARVLTALNLKLKSR